MKDILSQNQIDDLIKNMSSNAEVIVPIKKERVRVYDFKKPNKFTREQIRTFEDIYGNFSKIISLKLSDRLRANCFLDVNYIEEQTFFEYTNSIPKSSLIGVYKINNFDSYVSIELSYSTSYSIIDLMLGGNGNENVEFNGYTDIEMNLVKRVLKMLSQPIIDVWSNYVDLEVDLERLENVGQHIQIAAPNDVIAIITIKAEIANKEGFLNFCIPYSLVDPVLKEFNSTQKFSNTLKENDKSYEEYIKEEIVDNSVEISCCLGKAYLTLDDISKMQVGDVIKLKRTMNEKAEVMINNKPKFLADIGIKNNKYAIMISNTVEGKK